MNIKTLIPDIYKLLESNKPIDEGLVEAFGKRLTEMLKARLCNPTSGARPLSMSSLGNRCLRQLWYKEHKPDSAEPVDGPTRIKFLHGDWSEELVLFLSEASGHKVTGRQTTLSLHDLPGHRDAVIDGHLVDVKSANSRGFDKFKDHKVDDTFGYRTQLDVYLEASQEDEEVKEKKEASFLAIDKELGHLVLDTYPRTGRDYKSLIDKTKSALSSDRLPPRGYSDEPDGASGNRALPVECRYCAWKNDCWADANDGQGLRKFIYSNGPRWLTKVLRLPNVPEESNNARPDGSTARDRAA